MYWLIVALLVGAALIMMASGKDRKTRKVREDAMHDYRNALEGTNREMALEKGRRAYDLARGDGRSEVDELRLQQEVKEHTNLK